MSAKRGQKKQKQSVGDVVRQEQLPVRGMQRNGGQDASSPSVMNDVPRGYILGTILFNIFINDLDSKISKLAEDTKMSYQTSDKLEGRDAIYRDMTGLTNGPLSTSGS